MDTNRDNVFEFESSITEELLNKLRFLVDDERNYKFGRSTRKYSGKVSGSTFQLKYIKQHFCNGFKPIIYGEILERNGKSIVKLKYISSIPFNIHNGCMTTILVFMLVMILANSIVSLNPVMLLIGAPVIFVFYKLLKWQNSFITDIATKRIDHDLLQELQCVKIIR